MCEFFIYNNYFFNSNYSAVSAVEHFHTTLSTSALSVSALEVLYVIALYKSTFTLLTYLLTQV